jgi:hypothetical protein
MTSNDLNC